MMEHLGRIPEQGDQVPIPVGILRVDYIEGRRVDRIRFIPDSIGEGLVSQPAVLQNRQVRS